MNGLKGVLSIFKKLNSKFITTEEIDSGKYVVTFKGFTTY